MNLLTRLLAVAALLSLTACGALHTSVAKRQLDVQTKMSSSIFLEPVDPELRTVYVDIRNTSDKPEFNVREEVILTLRSRGYQVIDSPSKAHYWLQANVLQVGRSNARDSQGALAAGPGAVGGAVTGAVIHRSTGGSVGGTAGAAVAGAVVGTVVDAMVQDVYYSVITDIQIMERFAGQVQERSEHTLLQGDSGSTRSSYSQQTNMRKYQTRIVSSANQANLKWETAAQPLTDGVARALAGLF
ncbi:complement resistance protein TraT [Alishewanella sp. 16-MA]|uniref:Complement resistance protein TraT n=1 Tax=Alishewanella maricola TaxID=2795740 RepID=A0ABS8BZ86_9ALTE|nr:complement resistance protein TraT [Alishewanella maricola]MCB5225384.1 complement resistance protein TraT [Alishewanella maricola]MDP5036832.1 complement resistance protein TraT [Alishewanella sp.]MDP5187573.1 complement resistance protein TraT [Alishewanella sp.]